MKNLLKVFLGICLIFNTINYAFASSGNTSGGIECDIIVLIIVTLFFSFQFIWK